MPVLRDQFGGGGDLVQHRGRVFLAGKRVQRELALILASHRV